MKHNRPDETQPRGDALLLKLGEVQRRLSVSRSTVYALGVEKKLDLVKVRGGTRITSKSVDRYYNTLIAEVEAKPAGEEGPGG